MQAPAPKSGMSGWLKGCLIALVIFLILVAVVIYYTVQGAKWVYQEVTQELSAEMQKSEEAVLKTPEEEVLKVDLATLEQEFTKAPLEAAKKYSNKVVQVKGQVAERMPLPFNLPVDYFILTTESGNESYLFCGVTGQYKAQVDALKTGDKISIRGKYRDMSDEENLTLMFWPCVLEPK